MCTKLLGAENTQKSKTTKQTDEIIKPGLIKAIGTSVIINGIVVKRKQWLFLTTENLQWNGSACYTFKNYPDVNIAGVQPS